MPAIAKYFNVDHYSTVSRTVRRLNDELEVNGALVGEFDELNSNSQDLTPEAQSNRNFIAKEIRLMELRLKAKDDA